jgi:hypothetical protein
LPDLGRVFEDILGVLGAGQAETFNERQAQAELDLQNLQNLSQEQLGQFNLQGVLAQADAQRFAASQSADATKFAASESTRGQIESTRISTQSAERQIGLSGEQERLTQGQRLESEERQIGLRGREERLTQADLLASQERQIGLTGQEERLTTQERGRQERLGIETSGTQERLTQGQRLESEERQIGLRGEQDRLTVSTQGREQRETDLQQELFRRFKEQKDADQAQRAFRA